MSEKLTQAELFMWIILNNEGSRNPASLMFLLFFGIPSVFFLTTV